MPREEPRMMGPEIRRMAALAMDALDVEEVFFYGVPDRSIAEVFGGLRREHQGPVGLVRQVDSMQATVYYYSFGSRLELV